MSRKSGIGIKPGVIAELLLVARPSPLLISPTAAGSIFPFCFRRESISLSCALTEPSNELLHVGPRHIFHRTSHTTSGFPRRIGSHRPCPLHLCNQILADIKIFHADFVD